MEIHRFGDRQISKRDHHLPLCFGIERAPLTHGVEESVVHRVRRVFNVAEFAEVALPRYPPVGASTFAICCRRVECSADEVSAVVRCVGYADAPVVGERKVAAEIRIECYAVETSVTCDATRGFRVSSERGRIPARELVDKYAVWPRRIVQDIVCHPRDDRGGISDVAEADRHSALDDPPIAATFPFSRVANLIGASRGDHTVDVRIHPAFEECPIVVAELAYMGIRA